MSKNCLFYLHNTFENNHYALVSFIRTMEGRGVKYSFIAKRFVENDFASIPEQSERIQVQELPLWDGFWQRYDLLHAIYDGNPALACCMAAYMFNVPFILSFHGGYDTNCKIFQPGMAEKVRLCVEHSAYTTVVCQSDKDALIALGCPEERIVLTPPAIDLSFLSEIDYSKDSQGAAQRITVVGRLIEKKGIDVAIRALKLLPEDYTLDIVGDGELKEQLHQLAEELEVQGRIRWHGEIPLKDTLKVMAGNDLFWHPARQAADGNAEGIPQILVYAVAMKRGCIASDSGHIRDLMGALQGSGMIAPDDPQALATATMNHENFPEEFAKRCHGDADIVKEEYSVEAQLRHWVQYYGM